ncbi:thiamine phosphate synthase [Vibrio sp. MEBiC08052]|uniref:thiamine phosphate synthase n=1 Tax=Vibrio sp. MEBiC08052 TaxID=1761910 RepID=UPI000740649F|nr:thiamine phosphate synthase [Vibrio sp. MEBiC08052]KUI96926.1 thiamine-phosphate pyrophosphorylase [Vibrio sp. MEBiC08052]
MIGLSIAEVFCTTDLLASVKVNLHRVLNMAQSVGLAGPEQNFLFDADSHHRGLYVRLKQDELRNKSVVLMAVEQQQMMTFAQQQDIQQHYHISYCEQIHGCELMGDGDHLWAQQDEQQAKAKAGMAAHIVVASSPQPDAPHSELWRVGNEVRSLSSATFSTVLAPEVLDSETTRSDDSQHAFVAKHLAWLIGALVLDFPLEDALIIARASMNVSRETWPRDGHAFPVVSSVSGLSVSDSHQPLSDSHQLTQRSQFKAVHIEDLSLYPVVDDVIWVDKLLRLGVKTIQLRIKNPHQPDLEQQIKQAVSLGRTYQAQVFINDYWQLAIQYQAFGVHLGQEDLHTADIQALHHAGICLGISTHGYWEILKAQQLHPSYIALGHIFPTTTKQMPSQPQGLARLRLYQQLVDSIARAHQLAIPTVAIGGIDLNNAATVLEQGVSSLAVVRAVTQAANTASAVDAFQQLFLSRKEQSQSGRKGHVVTR